MNLRVKHSRLYIYFAFLALVTVFAACSSAPPQKPMSAKPVSENKPMLQEIEAERAAPKSPAKIKSNADAPAMSVPVEEGMLYLNKPTEKQELKRRKKTEKGKTNTTPMRSITGQGRSGSPPRPGMMDEGGIGGTGNKDCDAKINADCKKY